MVLSMAWRNLWRNPRRTLLTALTMALSVAFCIFMNSVTAGFMKNMRDAVVDRNLGHLQLHHKDYPETMSPYDVVPRASDVIEILKADPEVTNVAPRIQSFAMFSGPDKDAATGAFIGVDPEAEATLTRMNERVLKGRWLKDDAEAILGHRLADKLNLDVGGELLVVVSSLDGSIGNQVYPVVGIYESGNMLLDQGAMLPLAKAQEIIALPDGVHELVVLTRGVGSISPVQERTRSRRPGIAVRTWYEISPETKQMEYLGWVSSAFFMFAIIGVSAFIIINTLLMSVYERTQELGLLASLGLRPMRVIGLVLAESSLLALISAGSGFLLGMLGHYYLATQGLLMEVKEGQGFVINGVALDPIVRGNLTPEAVWAPILAVIFVSVVGGLWPAWRASRLDPVIALKSGGGG